MTGGGRRPPRRNAEAFTMVEIALSIAVVAFALVAIIGVLPTGVRVQRDNREETIINNDGTYWIEALRSGSLGLDEMTNYVDRITIQRLRGTSVVEKTDFIFGDGTVVNGTNTFTNGTHIVGLLGTPKYSLAPGDLTNRVLMFARAINGAASEKPDGGRSTNREFAFSYRITPELVPFGPLPYAFTNFTAPDLPLPEVLSRSNNWLKAANYQINAWDLRLTIEWPLYQRGRDWMVGNNRKVFRTMVSGILARTNVPILNQVFPMYFIQPCQYVLAR